MCHTLPNSSSIPTLLEIEMDFLETKIPPIRHQSNVNVHMLLFCWTSCVRGTGYSVLQAKGSLFIQLHMAWDFGNGMLIFVEGWKTDNLRSITSKAHNYESRIVHGLQSWAARMLSTASTWISFTGYLVFTKFPKYTAQQLWKSEPP